MTGPVSPCSPDGSGSETNLVETFETGVRERFAAIKTLNLPLPVM